MRVFLDANILFSAAKSDGAVRQLLAMTQRVGHSLLADEYVVAEARRNLEFKAPAGVTELDRLLRNIEVSAHVPHPLPATIAPGLPEKDRPVLAAAIRLRCGALVTGDRTHFGALYGTSIEGVTACSPRQFAERFLLPTAQPGR